MSEIYTVVKKLDNSDIIRTDGNEFVIYLVGYTQKQITSYIHKLNKEIKKLPYEYGAEFGYSMIIDDIKTIEDALNEATKTIKEQNEKIDLNDMDLRAWRRDLERDVSDLSNLYDIMSWITPDKDLKLQKLKEIIDDKIKKPVRKQRSVKENTDQMKLLLEKLAAGEINVSDVEKIM